jgi:hypothetical protein
MQRVTLFLVWAVAATACVHASGASASSLAAAVQQSGNEFRWTGQIARGKALEIKGVNGDVDAVLASGNQVEVLARKRGRRSDPGTVDITVVEHDGGVTICAVYPTPARIYRRRDRDRDDDFSNECRPGDEGRMNVRNNDVQVDFTVRLPAGTRFIGHTVNGSVLGTSLRSDIEAYTVNGRIEVSTSGVASAETVNGSILATLGATKWDEALDFRTVNGTVALTLPAGAAAELHAETMNGGITSDFPISIQTSRRRGHRITGTIGSGGRALHISTVNGGIRLRSAGGNRP